MKITSSTELLIENLLEATYSCNASGRQKFVFREALLGLVRLAKAEQVLEMRTTVENLIGGSTTYIGRSRTKHRQRNGAQSGRVPQQMEFQQFED